MSPRSAGRRRFSARLRVPASPCRTIRLPVSQRLLPQLPFALIEIPQLASGYDSPEVLTARPHAGQVSRQRGIEPRDVVRQEFLNDGIRAQALDLTADKAHRLVKGIRERVAGIAA